MNKEIDSHEWFNDAEKQFFAGIVALWRQTETGLINSEQGWLDMEAAGDDFDNVHGSGSVRSIFARVQQRIEWKRERSALLHRHAMRVLGPQIGDFAAWLNDNDAAFLKSLGIKYDCPRHAAT